MNISDEAVEAAANRIAGRYGGGSNNWEFYLAEAREVLEAAAPYMHDRAAEDRLLAMAWSDGAMAATANPAGARLANPFRKDFK